MSGKPVSSNVDIDPHTVDNPDVLNVLVLEAVPPEEPTNGKELSHGFSILKILIFVELECSVGSVYSIFSLMRILCVMI